MKSRGILAVFLCLTALCVQAQTPPLPAQGDSAVAEQYLLWIEDAMAAQQWPQVRAALERAADFSADSSDISYLMALTLSHNNAGREAVLQALERAIAARRWTRYSEAAARFMQAQQLVAMRRYTAALDTLAVRRTLAGDDADSAVLRLAALRGLALGGQRPQTPLPLPAEFRQRMVEAMDRYPRDTRPLRLLFSYAAWREPAAGDAVLLELALKRLPYLMEIDSDLAWMAAPFMQNDEEARRLVAAYRGGSLQANGWRPDPASIAPALNLGLLDDIDAADELFFNAATLDKDIVVGVYSMLRSEEGRDHLVQSLLSFTGTITEDADHDGIPENRAVYRQGVLQEYHSDIDQDGIADLSVMFDFGNPRQAELAVVPAGNAVIHLEQYPSVRQTVLGTETYQHAPGALQFSPVSFEELCATESYTGLMFPRRNPRNPGLSRQMLGAFAVSVQRPSIEFEGGVEHIHLERGLPLRAEIILNGAVVSVTEFENGRPHIQRVDIDRDGRMETVRRFHRRSPATGAAAGAATGDTLLDYRHLVESSESDWNGDGVFEYRELYRANGSVVF